MTFAEVSNWLQVAAVAWFAVTTAARSLRLRRRLRRNPILLGLRHDGVGGVLALTEFITTNVWILVLLASVLPIEPGSWSWLVSRWKPPLGMQLTGQALILVAFVLRHQALQTLGDSWRLGLDHVRPGPLVTTGPYSWSRNPVYVFFDLWMLGAFLASGVWAVGLLGLASALQLHALTLQEEVALREHFGDTYREYAETVQRYLGKRPQPDQAPASLDWRAKSRSR